MIELLLDFGSAEGERMRNEANAELHLLNGTVRIHEVYLSIFRSLSLSIYIYIYIYIYLSIYIYIYIYIYMRGQRGAASAQRDGACT